MLEIDADAAVNELEALAKALRAAGEKELRRELLRGLAHAADDLKPAIAASALAVLPKGGGLAAYIAGMKIVVKSRMYGRNASVRLVGRRSDKSGGVDLDSLDRGNLRHPVYGHRGSWVGQSVEPGFWSTPILEGQEQVRENIVKAINTIAQKLENP